MFKHSNAMITVTLNLVALVNFNNLILKDMQRLLQAFLRIRESGIEIYISIYNHYYII